MTGVLPMSDEPGLGTYPVQIRRWLPAIVLAIAVLYALAVNGQWAIRPDSGLYLALGRSLADGRGMEFNGQQTWGIPPLLPGLVAACRLLAGPHFLWLLNGLISLCALGTALAMTGVVNRLTPSLSDRARSQLIVGTLLVTGLSARLFADATRILTDVPFAFFFLLCVYAFVRSRDGHWAWCLLGTAAILIATAARLASLALFPPVVLAVVLAWGRPGYRKRLLATGCSAVLVAAAFGLWLWAVRGQADPGSADYFQGAEARVGNIVQPAYWSRMLDGVLRLPQALADVLTDQKMYGVNLVPAALIAVGMVAAARRRQWIVVLPVVCYVAFLIAWAAEAAVAARYLLPVMPLCAYLLVVGARWTGSAAVRWSRHEKVRRAVPHAVAAVAVVFCLAVSLPRSFRSIYWARHEDFYRLYEHGDWEDVIHVSQALRHRGRPETDVVATPEFTVVHYLTRLRVVTGPLWEHEGKTVGMWNPEAIPPRVFADAVVAREARFLVIPTDEAGWSDAALEALAETGAFGPPQPFGDLALLERRAAAGPGGTPSPRPDRPRDGA
jgi:4-amino-4-deoxy-L-arabinose transferase-like glycosyltransferase